MPTTTTPFQGDQKAPLVSPLAAAEAKLINRLLPHFPRWVHGHHLTLMTIIWSAGVIFAGWRAQESHHWLWLSSAMLFLQWFTDSFDGKLGKLRRVGIRRWGYFMDHFLDYVFMACVMGHYAFFVGDPAALWFLILVPLYGAFEAVSWLEYGATGTFRITYLFMGPTEIRLVFIGLNTAIIVWGTAWLAPALLPALIVLGLALCVVVYTTQRRVWAMDMTERADEAG
ncbi:MAG: hypothetical protein HKN07_08100 [Acidimicrobiia bacterium]|nr:hypothetical protein [Acidimicrobiia bacterium]